MEKQRIMTSKINFSVIKGGNIDNENAIKTWPIKLGSMTGLNSKKLLVIGSAENIRSCIKRALYK